MVKKIKAIGNLFKSFVRGDESPRFQKFSDREYRMEHNFSDDFFRSIQSAKEQTNNKAGMKWKDAIFMKDPFTMGLYLQLLQELRPKTVIEIGSLEGGSAVWFFDMLEALGVETKVYSYDINLSRIKFPNHKSVTFLNLDSYNIEEEFIMPDKIERPLLIIEDAHVNLAGVLAFLSNLMLKGDYLVVEDTIDSAVIRGGRGTVYSSDNLNLELVRFMEDHLEDLLVDSYFTDNYGYNVCWNWNSVFKKIK